MERWNAYLDTQFCFDRPASLAHTGVLDPAIGQVLGSASGHYRARTVRPHLQYFDCDLQFPEPLRIDKVLPGSLCIVQVLHGQWQHRVDGRLNRYTTGAPHALGLSESMEAVDQLPAGSHARMAGLRISGDYLRELAEEDPTLQPLLGLLDQACSSRSSTVAGHWGACWSGYTIRRTKVRWNACIRRASAWRCWWNWRRISRRRMKSQHRRCVGSGIWRMRPGGSWMPTCSIRLAVWFWRSS